jgi:hypothetical protein
MKKFVNEDGERVLTEEQFDKGVRSLRPCVAKRCRKKKESSTRSEWAAHLEWKKQQRNGEEGKRFNARRKKRYKNDHQYRQNILDEQEQARRESGSLPRGHNIEKAGYRFGKLVLLERPHLGTYGNIKKRLHIVRCKCDCGTEKICTLQSLRNGESDCGCMDKERHKKIAERRHKEILILEPGMKFNRWTVIERGRMQIRSNSRDRRQVALCRCECGTEKKVQANTLTGGHTKSCGCHRSEVSSIIATERIRTGSNLRHRWLYINEYEEIEMRSMWELALADALDHYGYEWEYEPEVFKLTKSKRYIPDFYLPEEDRWIEVKGDNYLKMFLKTGKREMFEKLGHTLDMVMKKDIERITGMSDQRLRDYYADRHVKA